MSRKENYEKLSELTLKVTESFGNYAKEKQVARSIASCAPYYEKWPEAKKKQLRMRLSKLDLTILGFILEELSEEMEYVELFNLVEEYYVSLLASNGVQARFLKESLEYKKENYKKAASGIPIDKDTYNYGKHCDKFTKRKSGKKAKGKAYARVRVKEVSF